jgi:IclR family acetate operon transcriptional repressor
LVSAEPRRVASVDDADYRPRVQSAARTVAILQAVAHDDGQGVAAKRIAADLNLPRQVVYHLLHTLTDLGMVRKSTGSRYVLGLAVSGIAEGFKRQMHGPDLLGMLVRGIAEETRETAYAVGWVDGEVVVRATAGGKLAIHAAEVPIGTAGMAHCRASGKLLLSMLPCDEVEAYLASHPMKGMTRNTITTVRSLKVEIEKIRQTWESVEFEEYTDGLACMAVPLGAPPTRLVLGLSVPAGRFKANQKKFAEQLKLIASRYRVRR